MVPHRDPFFVGKLAGLIQDFKGDRRFAHVVKERGQAEICQRDLGIAGTIGQGNGEQGDVDRVVVSVLIVASQSGQSQDGGLVLHH